MTLEMKVRLENLEMLRLFLDSSRSASHFIRTGVMIAAFCSAGRQLCWRDALHIVEMNGKRTSIISRRTVVGNGSRLQVFIGDPSIIFWTPWHGLLVMHLWTRYSTSIWLAWSSCSGTYHVLARSSSVPLWARTCVTVPWWWTSTFGWHWVMAVAAICIDYSTGCSQYSTIGDHAFPIAAA